MGGDTQMHRPGPDAGHDNIGRDNLHVDSLGLGLRLIALLRVVSTLRRRTLVTSLVASVVRVLRFLWPHWISDCGVAWTAESDEPGGSNHLGVVLWKICQFIDPVEGFLSRLDPSSMVKQLPREQGLEIVP